MCWWCISFHHHLLTWWKNFSRLPLHSLLHSLYLSLRSSRALIASKGAEKCAACWSTGCKNQSRLTGQWSECLKVRDCLFCVNKSAESGSAVNISVLIFLVPLVTFILAVGGLGVKKSNFKSSWNQKIWLCTGSRHVWQGTIVAQLLLRIWLDYTVWVSTPRLTLGSGNPLPSSAFRLRNTTAASAAM